ncbi:MAG: alpha/beta fold hydrolase [Nevskia sp.]|nr:alpha/beta fold hydrolase [Nevskia sp.]
MNPFTLLRNSLLFRGVWPFRPWMEDLQADPGWAEFRAFFEQSLDWPDDNLVHLTAVDGTRLALRAFLPAGEPQGVVVMTHALTLNGKFYRQFGGALAEAGLAAFLLDLRGHGRSAGRAGDCPAPHLLKADLALVHTTLQALYPGRPVSWIGHSVGAMLGWKMLSETNVRPAAFVSIGAGPIRATIWRALRTGRVIMWPAWHRLLREGLGPWARFIRVLVPRELRRSYEFVLDYTPRFFLAALPWRLDPRRISPRVPILAVIGQQDQGYDPAVVGDFVAELPGQVDLQIHDDADHLNILRQAGPAIIRWLQQAGRGAGGKSVSVARHTGPLARPAATEQESGAGRGRRA